MGDKKDEIKEILKEYNEELLSKMEDLFQAYLCRPISENKDDVSVEAEEKLKKQLDLQKDSNQELQEKLKTQEEQLKQQEEDLNSFKDKFDDLMKYWKMYQGLSDNTKTGLENVVKADEPVLFLVSCTSENSIYAIWSCLRNIIVDPQYQEDAVCLGQIFDYCFDVFNKSCGKPKYERDDVRMGQFLDDQYHSRTADSNVSGSIQKVYLQGYRTVNTKKIIGKSLVKA